MGDVLTLRRSVKLRIRLFLHLYIYYIQLPSIILSAFLMYFNLALFTILKFFISFLFFFFILFDPFKKLKHKTIQKNNTK